VTFIDTDFGNDDGLLAKVAMRKGRDKTHFDGQANDSLERGTDCHRQHREKASRKETTPMERVDADDEGVEWRHRWLIPRQEAEHIIDDGKAEDRQNIRKHGTTWLVPIASQHIKQPRKEV